MLSYICAQFFLTHTPRSRKGGKVELVPHDHSEKHLWSFSPAGARTANILGRHLGRIQDYGLGSGYVGLSNAVDASRISYVAFCLGLTKNCLLLWRSGMPVPPDHSATHLGSFNPARAGTAKCIARKTDLVPLVVRSCCGGGGPFVHRNRIRRP